MNTKLFLFTTILFIIALAISGCVGNDDADLVEVATATHDTLVEVSDSQAVDLVKCQEGKSIIRALTQCMP